MVPDYEQSVQLHGRFSMRCDHDKQKKTHHKSISNQCLSDVKVELYLVGWLGGEKIAVK